MLFQKSEYLDLFVCLFVCLFGGIAVLSLPGCQRHDNSPEDNLDPVLLNSTELEQYIIAGVEYEHALNTFQAEISKVDFSELKFEKDSNGRQVMRLPVTVNIEKKAQTLEQKKQSLRSGFPQFVFLPNDLKSEYIQTCIKNSVTINSRFLDLGININLPRTKRDKEFPFGGEKDYMEFLADWVENSFDEIVVIVFEDGSATYYRDIRNHPTQSFTPDMQDHHDGTYSYQGKKVKKVIHSQPSSSKAGPEDIAAKLPGIEYGIYNGGTVHEY